MSFLSGLLGAAAPAIGGFFGGPLGAAAGSALGGALTAGSGSKQTGNATTTQQNQIDPRIGNIVFGSNGDNGLLSQYQALGNTPSNPALKQYGDAAGNYLSNNAAGDMSQVHNVGSNLASGGPGTSISSYATGNMVQAPAQNNIDLTGSYNRFINGQPGANPYLAQSLQNAVGLTNASYQQNQNDLTNNLMRNVMPGIRGGAIAAGQYGSSRQGIAEGNAMSDYTKQLNNANLQLGLANSANTTGQQANAYNADSDRALAATQGLGAQQYATAMQNANTKNQAEFMNVANSYDANKTNANMALQSQLAGAGLLSGNLNNAYGTAAGQDMYGLQKAGAMNSLLTPYLGMNQSQTTSQPIYQNTGANLLGGATAGLGLYNGLSNAGLFGGTGTPSAANTIRDSGSALLPSGWTPSQAPVNTSALTNFGWLQG